MGNITVYGFPVSTFVNIVRLVLTEKGVPFTFCDLESEMGVRAIWRCIRSTASRFSITTVSCSTKRPQCSLCR